MAHVHSENPRHVCRVQQPCKRITARALFDSMYSMRQLQNRLRARLESSIFNLFVQNPGRRQIRESDGFAQRLLIRPPEHRATKKPLLAGYGESVHESEIGRTWQNIQDYICHKSERVF